MSLTRMIKKIKKDRNELKVLFLGLDNAGKTTIIYKLFNKETNHISPTFGYQIHSLEYFLKNDQGIASKINITLLDVGGQACFRKYWSNYYEKLDGIVFVFDATDPRTFNEFLNKIAEENDNKNIPILILANKCDLLVNDRDKIMDNNYNDKIKTFECSGRTGENLDESFVWLVQKMIGADIKTI